MPNDRPDPAPAAVALRGVGVRAGAARLLDGVDVAFGRGRFAVLLGPNGAGKSTLLRVATGLVRPAEGTVTYAGRSLADFGPAELARTRAVLSQHVELAFPLTAADVVAMGRYPHYGRAPGARDRAVVDEALALVGLAARRDQAYPTLSGGERQKVHLARVLAQLWPDAPAAPPNVAAGPALRVLFLDEPTASLDVHYQLAVLDLARDFVAGGGTVVAVLHDLNVALRYADDVVLLDGGRVVHHGDDPGAVPHALLERVFRVRMHAVPDGASGTVVWRFERAGPVP